jgi:DNA-binding transcriptional ArsR family regulator
MTVRSHFWEHRAVATLRIATTETEISARETTEMPSQIFGMSGSQPSIAEIAALVGDPARVNMLTVLLDSRALTATELAYIAGVSPQTASGHLGRLTESGLLVVCKQGRHSYFRLASPMVARMLEGIMAVAAQETPPRYRPRWRGDEALRTARTCYDHLAGRLGVALADALVERGHVVLSQDGGMVTATGEAFLTDFGVDLRQLGHGKRAFCRPCLDWSERRPHLAGAFGAAFATRSFELGWLTHLRDTRALAISAKGRAGLAATFGIALSP